MSSAPDDTTRLTDQEKTSPDELEISLPDWDEYKIESLLGEGGMARVYKAFDPNLKRFVALKFIRSDDENLRKRLLREARSQAQIDHDHVCKIYEVGEVAGKSFIAMQLIQGGTLQDLAAEMSLEQKALLIQQISDAVQAAHRIGIIHRDIKPSNIMMERREDGSFRPYIMDFGIARHISDPRLTASDAVMGTPAYMAPEQLLGDPDKVDRRTDIYGLGATLYYALAGRLPFQGSGIDFLVKLASEDPVPLKKVMPNIPDDLDIIISKCLEKDVSRRYDSARALAEDLKRYLEGEPILAHRSTWTYRIVKKIKKNKVVTAILALASLLIVLSALFGLASYWRASRQVEITRRFSQPVEAMDWIMRVAHIAPLHDIGRERQEVLQRMREIETMMKTSGSAGVAPGNFALGRGFLALQDYDKAKFHLEKAWNAGYQGKEVSGALGLTLGALFKRNLSEVDRISDRETRKVRLQAIEKEYRDPAVRYLRSGTGGQSREYGEALIAYYEKKWDKALQLSRKSIEKFPWLYEATLLEGDVFVRLGELAYEEGNFGLAKQNFQNGAASYGKAAEISRSDPALYESQCLLWRAIMEVQFNIGEDATSSYEQSKQYGRKAIAADPNSATAFELLAQAAWRWGENQFEVGEDPLDALNESVELSRKAQALSPDRGYPYYTMGTALGYIADHQLRTGKDPTASLNQSIKALRASVEKDPTFAPAFTNLGVSYFSQGALAMERGQSPKKFFLDAIEAYKKALLVSPRHLAARANIANAFAHLGLDAAITGSDPTSYYRQSVENYKKALEINPNHWLIRSNLANVYLPQMRYDAAHGKDPTDLLQKTLEECQKAEKLKPGNPYSAINGADAYVSYAEYALDKNENPIPWIRKGEQTLASVIGLEVPEVYLALAYAKRIEAEYALRQKQSPLAFLHQSKLHLDQTFKINSADHLVPLGLAQLNLIETEWLFMQKRVPLEALGKAEANLRKALDMNPKSAPAFAMLGEISLKKAQWEIRLSRNPHTEVQKGLSAIARSTQLKPDLAEAYVTQANLQLLDAQSTSDRARAAILADGCIKSFERAFTINPLLRLQEKENFDQAKSLAESR